MQRSRATIAATHLEGKMGAKDNMISARDCVLMNMISSIGSNVQMDTHVLSYQAKAVCCLKVYNAAINMKKVLSANLKVTNILSTSQKPTSSS